MRQLLLLAMGAVLAGGCARHPTAPATVTAPELPNVGDVATVLQIRDGDSLQVAASDGSLSEVRLLGINAPEWNECHGDAARNALEEMLRGQQVTLVPDGDDHDQYGRLLRYAYAGGANLNLDLVTAGHAVVMQTGYSLQADFLAGEDEAIDTGRGLWARDACGAAADGDIAIGDFVADPPGADGDDLNAEWVAITNVGDEPIDLDGWTLRDESSANRYRFSPAALLDPGAVIRVHTGCGDDTATDVHWCSDGPVWSNGGDTIIVQDSAGLVAAVSRYPD